MRVTYDETADAAYLTIGEPLRAGEARRQVEVAGTPGDSTIVLDFDEDGRLLGVEVLGARSALRPHVIEGAEVPSAP